MEILNLNEILNLLVVLAAAAAVAGFMAVCLGLEVELSWFQRCIMLSQFWILIL